MYNVHNIVYMKCQYHVLHVDIIQLCIATHVPAVPSSVLIERVKGRGAPPGRRAPPDGESKITTDSSTMPSPSDVVYTVNS